MADPATLTAAKSFFNGGSSSRPPDPSSSKSYAAIISRPITLFFDRKLSSGRPSVDEIRPHVRTHWMMNSEVHIELLDPRHVIMRFSSQEDFIQAWTRESLVIKAYYLKFLLVSLV
ncbi:hypothetical protein FNV43_RR08249 [Rhamnella rubrinervis]|uniref:DUF4283 domain-containing protein n=1 Tax=Rhamnella rubrinervis TaxID=2594499 RepID=A0A8K0MMX2_9ROSA|nr:hypothetical protein FNV43_RR08249 [Rhamnella rubrinervis]